MHDHLSQVLILNTYISAMQFVLNRFESASTACFPSTRLGDLNRCLLIHLTTLWRRFLP